MKAIVTLLGLSAAAGTLAPHDPPRAVDFAFDVLPVLQRAGCSSAYCHGSATGRAGFKLSLFGGDPAADHAAIATELGGRRVDLDAPAESLLLLKARGRLAHGGGRRVSPDSQAHATLEAWIAAGAPWRVGPAVELADLALHRDGDRLVATATLRRGDAEQTRDVSDVALFSSTAPTVVDVDADGTLHERGPGQAFLLARFANRTARLRIVRPFGDASTDRAGTNTIDRAWHEHLAQLGLAPAARVDAHTLARRIHLDLVGRPPTPAELDAFVADPDVAATVARLTTRTEFAAVWGEHLQRWFEVPTPEDERPGQPAARDRADLVSAVVAGETLPSIADRVMRGQLGVLDRSSDPRDRAEYVGRTLLGMRIGCARCHDHPIDRWTQAEHLAFSACFAPPRPDGAGGTMDGAMFDATSGERIAPRMLDLGVESTPAGEAPTRAELVRWALDERHDAFTRNAANRVFAALFGRGLVEPLDDHRLGNPPLAPALLDAIVAELHRVEGSLPRLLIAVMASDLYASSGADEGPETAWLAARSSRALAPETHARAVAALLGRAPSPLPTSPLARELALRNGPFVRDLLAAGGTTVDATFTLCADADERVTELWRTILSRPPRPEELARFRVAAGDLSSFRDLARALLTSREFCFQR